MTINEACQVWIEQRIDELSAEGVAPYSIGKIIGQEVIRTFDAKIAASTIEKRAERRKKKNAPITTNVANGNADKWKFDVVDLIDEEKKTAGTMRQAAKNVAKKLDKKVRTVRRQYYKTKSGQLPKQKVEPPKPIDPIKLDRKQPEKWLAVAGQLENLAKFIEAECMFPASIEKRDKVRIRESILYLSNIVDGI
jgi:hypothetical protein